jgi:hypothetical protein
MNICVAALDLLATKLSLGLIKHHTIKTCGEKEGIAPRFLNLVHQMEVSGELHALAHLPPKGKAPSTHCVGGWVGPRSSLDAAKKKESLACIENCISIS